MAWLPRAAAAALPALDAITRRWLRRSASPYVADIEAIASTLGIPGIWFLNGCYQWGCTALARDQDGVPWLARTLDWPFPGLGRAVEIALMQGPAGPFHAIGWPGYVGVLTATATGRFAAAMNQAPLRRRTRRPWLRPYDMALNSVRSWRIRFMPPDHLLRQVFETCQDYDEAKRRLETIPIARPVIYTLVGCRHGECCVIERTEQTFTTRLEQTFAANDWLIGDPGWEARTRADLIVSCTYEEAATASRERARQLGNWRGSLESMQFDWVTPPVLNPYTRLAVAMCAARGLVRAQGYEPAASSDLPQPVSATAISRAVACNPAHGSP
ncbi:MAG: hypothetical protein IT536_19795 [Hyphomicrobiales bacterium]|nr:hypothetical protein [Hyphomicrobiales bacterium]